MEYLRNLPSKTNAFSSASYERVRGGSSAQDRTYFTTQDQTPKQIVQPSSDENLILAAIRHKKEISVNKSERPSIQQVPDPSESESGRDSPQPPRLYKRPRIAISNAAHAAQSHPKFNIESLKNGSMEGQ
ncbi:hypothetical protein BGZ76_007792 [Entomortierella beljakovae]|nr:hypothetical protein BGZ76_007792 [Entomortierella beljakovae]